MGNENGEIGIFNGDEGGIDFCDPSTSVEDLIYKPVAELGLEVRREGLPRLVGQGCGDSSARDIFGPMWSKNL